METIGTRIRLIRKTINLSATDFAKKAGVNRTFVYDVEAGRVEPSRNFLDALNKTYGTSYDWILTGKGEMFLAQKETNAEALTDETISEVTRLLADIDEQGKQAVLYAARQAERIVQLEKKLAG
jgi:transcriptional regulator with XRE-family HTH domain